MAVKNPLSLKRYLYVLVHSGSGTPYAFQLNLQKLSSILVMSALVLVSTVLGSLLFFRELEVNRKLQEQLLDLETREKLAIVPSAANSAASASTASLAKGADADDIGAVDTAARETSSTTAGRVSDLQVDCNKGKCAVKLALMTGSAQPAEGQLLIVLEAEIPRIGSGNAQGSAVRKRFFIYPGENSRDELDASTLTQLERKSFRFSRVLQTTANFAVGKLLRPLAVNAYIYDKDHALVQHERRAIDGEGDVDAIE